MRELLILLMLGGCAGAPVYKPVPVDMPITIPCRAPQIEEPDWPLRRLDPNASIFEKVKMLAVENELRKGYEEQLAAAVGACL